MDYQKIGQDYLKHVGVDIHDYSYEMLSCEVCSHDSFTVIRKEISLGKGTYGSLPIQGCNSCGYLMQNPRFDRDFYQAFYRDYYRNMIAGDAEPSPSFIEDQLERGRLLHQYLLPLLGDRVGTMLDVGCSAGGFLLPFRNDGWTVMGSDPDKGYVDYGQRVWGLPIRYEDSEDMELADESLDLVIIMGSLEHVYDPNVILQKCRKASKPDGLIVLEGRYSPLSYSFDYFNHNHHRYLREDSIESLLVKHGWQPIVNTSELICGPTRAGNGYCVGRVAEIPTREEFESYLRKRNNLRLPEVSISELDAWDYHLAQQTEE